MTIPNPQDDAIWQALQHDKQRQLVKARAIAIAAAFDDLPENEQCRYLALALRAVKADERESAS